MCGISLVIGADRATGAIVVNKMVAEQSHRGPDASGTVISGNCQLAHTRLSIIDLSTGNQPMSSHDGRYTITYNGEIYNFKEIRSELQRLGHGFRTSSDTEVILVAYRQWGTGCLDRFRGMFAFAIWDDQEGRLFCARDLFGEKPLYYAKTESDGLVVSSEVKGIIASGLVIPKLDLTSVDAYLAFGYVPPDRTIYKNVSTLPPAHYIIWQDGHINMARYWEPIPKPLPIVLEDAAQRLRELIEQAVERQMVSDVPVGAFLSGGLDSSTIVALMQQHSSRPVKTFSIGFGKWINELPYARAVAERYGTEHYEIDLGIPDVAGLMEKMATVYDEPFADTSNIPTFLISEFACKEVKVVLSGDGGDELFGGYAWYPPLVSAETAPVSYAAWIALRLLSKVFKERNSWLRTLSVACGMAARWRDPWERCMMSGIQFKEGERNKLWGCKAGEVKPYASSALLRPPDSVCGIDRGFYHDLARYLPGDILVKLDRAAMANSLETRAPFLDRDVVEFALSLPSSLKVQGGDTKVVLKNACMDLWPEELRTRGKQGFGAPTEAWLAEPRMQELIGRVFRQSSPLRELLPGIDGGMANKRGYKIWMLLVLGLWLERQGARS